MNKSFTQKNGLENLKEYMPELTSTTTLAIIVFSIIIPLFLVHMFNMIDWWAPIFIGIIFNILTYYSMARIPRNAEKIREKYRTKFSDRAYSKFFYHYVIPLIMTNIVIMAIILMVENSVLVPMLYPTYKDNLLYQRIIPWQFAIPLGVLLISFFFLMYRKSINDGFDLDTELFLYILYPEKGRILQKGLYKYIRHAHYAEGFYSVFALAFFSQNLIAFILAAMMIVTYYFIARSEDQELIRRYGESFKNIIEGKPMFFPRFKDIGSFFKLIFTGK